MFGRVEGGGGGERDRTYLNEDPLGVCMYAYGYDLGQLFWFGELEDFIEGYSLALLRLVLACVDMASFFNFNFYSMQKTENLFDHGQARLCPIMGFRPEA